MLQALTEHAESKGFREASHHVLSNLSERNGVLRDILKPALEALGGYTSDAGVISSKVELALRELRALSEG